MGSKPTSVVLGAAFAALWRLAAVAEAQPWTQQAKLTAADAAADDHRTNADRKDVGEPKMLAAHGTLSAFDLKSQRST